MICLLREKFLSEEIVLILCEITGITNREISIYLNRRGKLWTYQ